MSVSYQLTAVLCILILKKKKKKKKKKKNSFVHVLFSYCFLIPYLFMGQIQQKNGWISPLLLCTVSSKSLLLFVEVMQIL